MNDISVFKTLVSALLVLSASSAVAENTNVKSSQSDADKKGLYAPLGLRVGSFMLHPSLESENEWNDNIYYRQNNTVSDFIFHLKPTLNINSNWSRHALNLSVGSDVLFYKNHSTEDRQNYFVNLDGRFDVMKDSFATAKFYYQNYKEQRGSPEPVAGLSVAPLENETLGATVGYEHKFNRLRATVSHDIKHIDYKDNVDALGNPVLNSQRSRYVNATTARLGYELFSGYEAYLKGSYNFVDYDNPFTAPIYTNAGAIDRSSQGYHVAAGVSADIGHTLVGDAHIGYQTRDYASPALKSISGVTGGLALTWLPTRLTTVKLGIERDIMETTQVGLSGFFTTAFTASVDHELMRNVLLNFHAGYINNDYSGNNAVNRQDDMYNAGFNLKYLLNRYFYLKTGYDYHSRGSNMNGSNYDINNVYLTIGAQL